MTLGSGQLARHIGPPWRSAAGAASNTHDMQAASENTMAIMATAMAQATLTLHTAGWLEGGLTFGYEKFINDIEVLQTLGHFSKGVDQSAAAMSLDPITEVMPGGHFFETGQTMERYGSEFYDPLVADLSNFGTWEAAGPYLTRTRNIPVAGAVGRIYTTRGLRRTFGAHRYAFGQMREAGAHRFWINVVHPLSPVPKIRTCFSSACSLSILSAGAVPRVRR